MTIPVVASFQWVLTQQVLAVGECAASAPLRPPSAPSAGWLTYAFEGMGAVEFVATGLSWRDSFRLADYSTEPRALLRSSTKSVNRYLTKVWYSLST